MRLVAPSPRCRSRWEWMWCAYGSTTRARHHPRPTVAMTTDRLVVIAVDGSPEPAAEALARYGVTEVELQSHGAGRVLVSGRLSDDARARAVVAELRRQGWVATERPADDNPAIHAWRNRIRPVPVGDG